MTMIPIQDRETADIVLELAKGNIRDYRYDMLRFRLALCLKAPETWTMIADDFPNVSVTFMVRKRKADDDFDGGTYDVIRPRDDVTAIIARMVKELRQSIGKEVLILDLSNDELGPVMTMVGENYQPVRPTEHPFATFVLEEKQPAKSPSLPAGFSLRPLEVSAPYAENFNSEQGFLPGKNIKHLFCDYIRHLPSVGIFCDVSDRLVGYLMTNDYGSIGKLYVHPDYRRRGFATILIAHLTKRIVDEKYLDLCLINAYVWNEKSLACFRKLGYEYIDNSERNWFVAMDEVEIC